MPDLLGHFGAQAVITHRLIRKADVKWILLGCTVPDIPWIVQRIVHQFDFVNVYELRLYLIVQASLLGCLILSGALASLSTTPRRIFTILAFNSAFHLFLDACQTKWANGVHFIAPLSWKPQNWELFWPESAPNYLIQIFGLAYLLFMAWRLRATSGAIVRPPAGRLAIAGVFLAVYLVAPFAFMSAPDLQENAFVRTMEQTDLRPGRPVEFDRNYCEVRPDGPVLEAIQDEEIRLIGNTPERSGLVSIRGTFVDEHTVQVRELHVHSRWLRDLASYLGLVFLIGFWTVPWLLAMRASWRAARVAPPQPRARGLGEVREEGPSLG